MTLDNDPIHTAVEAAYAAVESQAPVETPAETLEKVEVAPVEAVEQTESEKPHKAADQPRKDDGKFDKKTGEKAAVKAAPEKADPKAAKPAEKKPEATEQPPADKPAPLAAPKHWSDARKEQFAKLPPDAQKFAAEAYGQFEREHSQRMQALQPHLKLAETAHKWGSYLQQIGTDGATAFHALLTAEAKLRTGTPAEKRAAFHKLATDYGIPLDQYAQEAVQQQAQQPYVDPQVQTLQQQLEAQSRWITQQEQNQRQAATQQEERVKDGLVNQISSFANEKDAAGNPVHRYFEDVADDMIVLVHAEKAAGRAIDLKTLYEKAVRYNPTVYQRYVDEQRQAAVERAKTAASARVEASQKAAVSTVGAPSGTGPSSPRFKGVEDTVSWAYDQASRA